MIPPRPGGEDVQRLTRRDYQHPLAFRTRLRRFLQWSQTSARQPGLTSAQHQLLLTIKATTVGRARPPAAWPLPVTAPAQHRRADRLRRGSRAGETLPRRHRRPYLPDPAHPRRADG